MSAYEKSIDIYALFTHKEKKLCQWNTVIKPVSRGIKRYGF